MNEDYRLLTPENVELQYPLAGVGSRILAGFVDYVILTLGQVVLFVGAAFSLSAAPVEVIRDTDYHVVSAFAVLALVALAGLLGVTAFLGWWGYFILFELWWNGQTPGKRMLGLRVIRIGGQPVTVGASLIRNLLRTVDVYLVAVGVIVMLLNRSSRRLGDLAAGTLVVHEPGRGQRLLAGVEIPEVNEARIAALPNAQRLTMAHYTLVRDYFARRRGLDDAQAYSLALKLSEQVAGLLQVRLPLGDPVAFLATVARAYEARNRYRDSG